ncbi:MAG: DNA ligase [Deltaproteobacteria bacterium]|nr:DNA ligase [Deltaproteobacteria bacterium]
MPPPSPLKIYRGKRDFQKTAEPLGEEHASESPPRFVIQKHQASTLHYDFRLEADGVLKSWAVPKGPSLDPREKRLAVATEDHPIEYADFEGNIPAGEYGGGTVLIWDEGCYSLLAGKDGQRVSVEEGLENGLVTIFLVGKKITGGYALRRFRTGAEEAWLLIKMGDEHANPQRNPVRDEPLSVRSGRSMEEIANSCSEPAPKPVP